jgi:menaquinol-cytochrome c reductase iron-sulfur subunit
MAPNGTARRGFLNYLTGALLAALGLLIAVPSLLYLGAPLRRRRPGGTEPGLVDAGPVADLPAGEWQLRAIEVVQQDGWKKSRVRHALWVRRTGAGEQDLAVLSPICPHLGCPVNWHADRSQFNCPCHGGTFDADGRHVAGPPPRSLDPLPFEVRGGRLWVRWQDYQIGVAGQVPVST